MSNRTRDIIYSRHPDDRQVLSQHKRESLRRITGGVNQRSNGFRLSDIHKLILGRHGGQCDDPTWMRRYFWAALPHILADAQRVVAAKGHVEAMIAWVTEHVPVMRFLSGDTWGDDWIEIQVAKHLAKPRGRRCPKVDRTARLLRVEDHEPETFKLCSVPAMSRSRKIRQAEDKARRAKAERDRRAKVDGYTPRAETTAARLRAEGTNLNTHYSRQRRARRAAEKAAAEAMAHPDPVSADVALEADQDPTPINVHSSSCPDLSDVHSGSCPTWVEPPCTAVRALHLRFPQAPIPHPTGNDLDLAAAEAQTTVAEWHRYLHETRASTVYGRQPLPTPEDHAVTMEALHAGAASAWAEFGAVVGF